MQPVWSMGHSPGSPFQARVNDGLPVLSMPPELFHKAFSYLYLTDLFRAALVCTAWRSSLLGAPHLWSCVYVTARNSPHLVELLALLLSRSGFVPLTLYLDLPTVLHLEPKIIQVDGVATAFDPESDVNWKLPALLIQHMPRMSSLALELESWSETGWEDLLTTPAPILRWFRIHTYADDPTPLPVNLFGDAAPLLRDMNLYFVYLPAEPGPVMAGVRSLYYQSPTFENDADDDLLKLPAMGSLRYLTLGETPYRVERFSELRGLHLRRLQMWNVRTLTNAFLSIFAGVDHICFSATVVHSPNQSPGDADWDLLLDTVRSHGDVQSLEIGFRRGLLPDMGRVEYIDRGPHFAVRLDGQDVVVDLVHDTLTRLLVNLPATHLLPNLRRLAILKSYWELFDVDQLPALDELTLFVAPGKEDWDEEDFLPIGPIPPEGPRRHAVALLRLVRVNEDITYPAYTPDIPSPLPVSVAHIQLFISRTIATRALQRLVLDGFRASHEDMKELCDAVPGLQIALELSTGYLEEDDCGPWKWFFPYEDCFCV